MKTIFTVVFASLTLATVSCNNRNDDFDEITNVDRIKIDSVEIISDTMSVNALQSIRTYSTYSSGCHNFYGYDYEKDNFTRKVTAYSYTSNGTCTQALHVEYNQINFRPIQTGTYTFNFWSGDNTYITKTIVVE